MRQQTESGPETDEWEMSGSSTGKLGTVMSKILVSEKSKMVLRLNAFIRPTRFVMRKVKVKKKVVLIAT